MKPRARHQKPGAPLDQAARLGVRDRIVALGHGLRSAGGEHREAQAIMLIELAALGSGDANENPSREQAAGPIELLTRIPTKWRQRHADDADARIAVLSLGMDTADPGLGKIVCRLLRDEEQRVRQLADEVVLRMGLRPLRAIPSEVLGEHYARIANTPVIAFPADPDVLELERSVLLRAVADAAWGFAAHRCRSPLIVTLLLMDHPWANRMEREISTRMRRLLSQRNHPSHAPLRSVLKRTDCPLLRERALRWLSIDAISSAALDRLRVAESGVEHRSSPSMRCSGMMMSLDAAASSRPSRMSRHSFVFAQARSARRLILRITSSIMIRVLHAMLHSAGPPWASRRLGLIRPRVFRVSSCVI